MNNAGKAKRPISQPGLLAKMRHLYSRTSVKTLTRTVMWLCFSLITLAGFSFGQIGTVQITSPNGGESWLPGSTHNITWTTSGNITSVDLQYTTNAGNNWTFIGSSAPATRTYSWTLPAGVNSTQCLVKILGYYSSQTVSDLSNAYFTIAPPLIGTVQITSPNGGEIWLPGSTHNITWTTSGNITSIDLQYTTNAGSSWTLIASPSPTLGTYSWTIPAGINSTQCQMKILGYYSGQTVSDLSNAYFTIAPIGTAQITSPNGGESWLAGSTHNITWTTSGNITSIDLQYTTNAGSSWTLIASPSPTLRTYSWTIPAGINSTQCQVRILGHYGGATVSDVSNANFTIAPPIGTVQITSPNGGEIWLPGSTHNITWTTSGNITSIDLQYTIDAGNNWTLIASPSPALGTYSWTIPAGINSTQCQMKILGYYSGQTVSDLSNANFTIAPPHIGTVQVVTPNGGESWVVGEQREITWTSNGNLNPSVDIQYSVDNGNTWEWLTSTENDGSYMWVIHPDAKSTQALIKVIGYYGSDHATDTANSPFVVSSYPNRDEFTSLSQWRQFPNVGTIAATTDNWRDTTRLTFPANNSSAGPGNGPAISRGTGLSDDPFKYGTFQARLKAAKCDQDEGIVSAMFTYWSGHVDSNGDGKIEGSEIDMEFLGHEPSAIYLNIWTAMPEDGKSASNVAMWINMQTGDRAMKRTWLGEDWITQSSLPSGDIIADYNCTEKYYVYGFDWSANSVDFWIYNGDHKIILWAYSDAAHIPSHASSLLFNAWHTNDWRAKGDSNTTPLDPPGADALLFVDWAEFPEVDPIGTVQMTSPNGGESWLAGSTHNIIWTTSGNIASIDLQYTIDAGNNWTLIASPTPTLGTYSWTIPAGINSTQCQMKILGYYGGQTASDLSNAYFTIVQPVIGTVQITSPNGGESWLAGSTHNITWTTSGNITSIDLQYTTNAGSTWTLIASPPPALGTYSWMVPTGINSTQCQMKILGYYSGQTVSDLSNAYFTIASPPAYNLQIYDNQWQTTKGNSLIIRGKVVDDNGSPVTDVNIGVEDPILGQSIPSVAATNAIGEFSYTVNTTLSTQSKNYSYVFFAGWSGECYAIVTISVGNNNELGLILDDYTASIGVKGKAPLTSRESLISKKTQNNITPYQSVDDRTLSAHDFINILGDFAYEYAKSVVYNPSTYVGMVGTLTCFIPSGVTQLTTCPAGITIMGSVYLKSAAKVGAYVIIDNLDLPQAEKDKLRLAVDSGMFLWSIVSFSADGSILTEAGSIASVSRSAYTVITDVNDQYEKIALTGSNDSETQSLVLWRIRKSKVDFNKDGQEDLIWRCYGTGYRQGDNVVWFMDRTTGALAPATLGGAQNMAGAMNLLTQSTPTKTYLTPMDIGNLQASGPGTSYVSPMDVGNAQTAGPKRPFISPLDVGNLLAPGQKKLTRDAVDLGRKSARGNSAPIREKDLNLQDPGKLVTGDIGTMALEYSDANLYTVLDTTWEIAGAGDFDGDGNTDILWRYYGAGQGQGTTIIWFMTGTTVSRQGYPYQISDLDWRIDRTGDFNGDGKTDVLWRYYGTGPGQGTAIIWCMDGANVISQIYPPQVWDTDWKIEGIGDFNGDGKADLLWRYYGTGQGAATTIIWYMDGATIIGQDRPYLISDTDWKVDGVGDFDGDGKADIVWRYYGTVEAPGTTIIWYMNGATIKGQDRPYRVSDLNWRIVNR